MRKTYLVAAVLCVAAAIIRTIDGELILGDARELVSAPKLLGFIHLTWYLVTTVFLLSAAFLVWYARPSRASISAPIGAFVGSLFIVWCAVISAIGFSFGWHPGTAVPAVVTLAIGLLCLAGSRTKG